MESMFYDAKAFNQPLDSWDTSAVVNMDYMFYFATAFDQLIGSWNISSLKSCLTAASFLKLVMGYVGPGRSQFS
jgi:surface protein